MFCLGDGNLVQIRVGLSLRKRPLHSRGMVNLSE